jgi:hypothetical protein
LAEITSTGPRMRSTGISAAFMTAASAMPGRNSGASSIGSPLRILRPISAPIAASNCRLADGSAAPSLVQAGCGGNLPIPGHTTPLGTCATTASTCSG